MTEQQNQQAALPGAAPFIVVVDDSPTIRVVLELTLKGEGCDGISFATGLATLQWLKSPQGRIPDLIILDLMIPRLGGYALMRYLKRDPELAAVPVIIITGHDDTVSHLKMHLTGATDYLIKPFTVQQIVAAARQYLDRPTLILPTAPMGHAK